MKQLLLLGLATLPIFGQYSYYYTDPFNTINPTAWHRTSYPVSPSGLTPFSGGLYSTIPVPDGTSDYEVQMTVADVTGNPTGFGRNYTIRLRGTGGFACATFPGDYYYAVTISTQGFLAVSKYQNGVGSSLLYTSLSVTSGSVLRAIVRSTGTLPGIIVHYGSLSWYLADTSIATGRPGVGMCNSGTDVGHGISKVELGLVDRIAPDPPAGLQYSATPTSVTLTWNPATDNANGVGLWHYHVYKDGVFFGSTGSTAFTDSALTPGSPHTYAIYSLDMHGNVSATNSAIAAQTIAEPVDPRRIGIVPTGTYFGAEGEQIDVLSGNLNFSLPLLKAVARGSSAVGLSLSYNSQSFAQRNGITVRHGFDVGYGLGWQLKLGSIIPVTGGYIFTDSSGAEHKLNLNANGVWRGTTGLYVYYDENLHRIYFNNGSFWQMDCISAGSEQDAGTRYPTLIQDSNGNQIKIIYRPAIGSTVINTSARIREIDDIRAQWAWAADVQASVWRTYYFAYNSDPIPHLTSITNRINNNEQYTFTYSNPVTLTSPFTGTTTFSPSSSPVPMLANITVTGLGVEHNFEYSGSSGELSRIVFPYGGEFRYEYMTVSFPAMNLQVREVQYRRLVKQPGATPTSHVSAYDHGPSAPLHFARGWYDETTGANKLWYFSLANDYTRGMVNSYLERNSTGGILNQFNYVWAQSPSGIPYVSTVSQTGARTSRVGQSIDAYGNVLNRWDYGATNPPVAVRTTTCTYVQDPNYLNRYLRNLPLSCTLAADGTTYTLFSNGYDAIDQNAPYTGRLHDSTNYPPQFRFRGNLGSWTRLGGGYGTAYHSANGTPRSWANNGVSGQATQFDANNDRPTSVSQIGVQTSLSYATFGGLTALTPSNANGVSFAYDAYARPNSQTTADGTVTFTYTNPSGLSLATRTATAAAGTWTKTYFDGFGRTVKEELGDSVGVKSIVETEYAPCGCTPMGKVSRISRPYAPGETPRWTTYTYDPMGRTLSISQPGGSGITAYTYVGSQTTVTDPSGRWKKYIVDAFDNLTEVREPNPNPQGGPDLVTTYTYNGFDKLTKVEMPRDGYTQERNFVYNSSMQLASETHPESGTTMYTYGQYGRLETKSDAKGQLTRWDYDSFGRVWKERHFNPASQELTCDEVVYKYDGYSSGSSDPSVVGRLAEVSWGKENAAQCGVGKFMERYRYDGAGRIDYKRLIYSQQDVNLTRTGEMLGGIYRLYGQKRQVYYPYGGENRMAAYHVDAMSRITGMSMKVNAIETLIVSDGQYNAAGQLTQMRYNNRTETREYNDLGQLERIKFDTVLRHEYGYHPTANDGRIISYKDALSGETIEYKYDSLARLTLAKTTAGPQWQQSFVYDGFGNLISKVGPTNFTTIADPATNRLAVLSYDNNGNVTNAPIIGAMTYDSRNRYIGNVPAGQLPTRGYDLSNRRIWTKAAAGSGCLVYIDYYLPDGEKTGTYCVKPDSVNGLKFEWRQLHFYFGGQRIKTETLSGFPGATEWMNPDRLGSNVSHLPYGDEINPTAHDRVKFATYYRESSGVLDYAMNRYYSPVYGRFTSPDPYRASGGPAIPGSWNRYAYVSGDPVNKFDPSGLDCESPDFYVAQGSGCGGGGGGGGSAYVFWPEAIRDSEGNGIGWGYAQSPAPPAWGGGGGKFNPSPDDPCDDIGTQISNTINGVRMPGDKSLLRRVVEQIVGGEEKYADHEEEIENYRNRLKTLRRRWNDNDCGDPPQGLDSWIRGTNPRLVRIAHDAYQAGKLVTTSYALYRIVRLIPSLIPPLWPTLPVNLAVP